MNHYTIDFQHIDRTKLNVVGGKGANLGELSRMPGINVPAGFCITTEAYNELVAQNETAHSLLSQLALLSIDKRNEISALSAQLRAAIEAIPIPQALAGAITEHLKTYGEQEAYAVRSSATAEDLPTASFAGQQDTYLNIIGAEAILRHMSKCWASLFTERAVTYRIQHGFDHRNIRLAVVVQKMVFPQTAGILFTADPVSGNRKIVSIDASFGLGEALVAGLVNADTYKVRNGEVIEKKIPAKKLAIYAAEKGGTIEKAVEAEQQYQSALTDEQVLQLERIGRTVEAHFGQSQDIEWCLVDQSVYVVQSRPITTLFPLPEVADKAPHVYVSVGHQQMMTDAMKPLGIAMWQLTAGRPMPTAGGRIFVDVADDLASPVKRHMLVNVLGKSDPLIRDAFMTLLERGDFIKSVPEQPEAVPAQSPPGPPPVDYQTLADYDPAIVSELIGRSETAIAELKQAIQSKSGTDLIDFIQETTQQSKRGAADSQSFGVIMTGMNAASWLNEHMEMWLGEKAVADTLTQSVPNNITSEMGLALLDVADAIRPYPDVIAYLQRGNLAQEQDAHFLDELATVAGGPEARNAINIFLTRYGMRCAGEIDITRPRWSEKPATLIPLILSNIKNFEPGESSRRFERGLREAMAKKQEILARLKQLPDGDEKVNETSRMIDLVRNLAGYREYPKYGIVSRYFVFKQALLKEAGRLVQAGVLHEKEDLFYLRLDELREVIRTHTLGYDLINQRKDDYKRFEKLTPPRVMTSDGEIITGQYKRDNLPADAIVGLPVSAGVIEGRARVILKMEDAELEEGDILVTPFTDPSWTPLFVAIKGLVTEVGGLMTHGAVIAREYGLPAVVGIDQATKLIKDEQRIRLNGTEGYIEIL
ncbi:MULTISPECIES: phosphoenolpyruvate synthase [unclassified Spirosoma]|uniref:phosphoenolpyruvate synthase n=1 Tax=unclassified Spirosoma TaxID=2621999 RepID=UPI00095EF18D|nr:MULTISPECIES: phosphoenolpyruvate synthase [unclassified Spirosoma]MBN8822656.1 phosphoenolpyruvate synthase [Spirosoma sp.]OJW74144.1 MAG: phosphoenolpyruvate synthase [Spirosoma sp. 48-14]